MNVNTLSERELKLVDSLGGVQEIRIYELGYPQTSVMMLFFLIKGQARFCALSSTRSVVKEFKAFSTMYSFLRKNCPKYMAHRIEHDQNLFDFHVLKRQPVVNESELVFDDAEA